jgi:MFS transporter, NNP family, nitrate/nitrite transporter
MSYQETLALENRQAALRCAEVENVDAERGVRMRVLWVSFIGFALMFAAWTMFGVLGIPIQKELGISDVQLAWLSAVAILNGAIWRLPLGVLSDRIGGRKVFLATLIFSAIAALAVSRTNSYTQLMVCAFLVGIGGNSFSVGSAWNAAWFPKKQQGFAMGLFGAGNVGASVTKVIGPSLIAAVPAAGYLSGAIPGGWRFVPALYAGLLLAMAVAVLILTPAKDKTPGNGRAWREMIAPLREVRVWRFSLYYTVVFGAYVALSVTLPKYYVAVYGLDLKHAALMSLPFIFASSLLRPLGGVLSDKFGPRKVTYVVFIVALLGALALFRPVDITTFSALMLVIGIAQGIGKASTIKYIPEYYPKDVGVVVGLVGALAAIGGFVMPPLFAYLKAWSGQPQSLFWVLAALSAVSLIWLHVTVLAMKRNEAHDHHI